MTPADILVRFLFLLHDVIIFPLWEADQIKSFLLISSAEEHFGPISYNHNHLLTQTQMLVYVFS